MTDPDYRDIPAELYKELAGPKKRAEESEHSLFLRRVLHIVEAEESTIDDILVKYWRLHSVVLRRGRVYAAMARLKREKRIVNTSAGRTQIAVYSRAARKEEGK